MGLLKIGSLALGFCLVVAVVSVFRQRDAANVFFTATARSGGLRVANQIDVPLPSNVASATEEGPATPPGPQSTVNVTRSKVTRLPGRLIVDDSHVGMVADEEGIHHAWSLDEHKSGKACRGAMPDAKCIDAEAVNWVQKHVLLGITTGKEGSFRVEVSQCTWLSHFPPDNVYVFTDAVPSKPHTPHRWMGGQLPSDVVERDGDVFSPYMKGGYIREVRRAGQGYSAGWIIAQFRFPEALRILAGEAQKRKEGPNTTKIKWIFLVDDDTVVQLNNLVKRVKSMDESKPWYLSRKGWGGAGHLFSAGAADRLHARLHECVDRWMVRQFRASDTMLKKCGEHLGMHMQLEGTMTHCPASHLKESLLNEGRITVHGKKDFYPPVLLATWRVALYYRALYCRSKPAMFAAVYWSACAYGSCKQVGCTKEKDREREIKWLQLSQNNSIQVLPLAKYQ